MAKRRTGADRGRRPWVATTRPLRAVLALCLAGAIAGALPAWAQGPGPEVFVPSLWDPASPPPKPGPSVLPPLLIIVGRDDPPFDMIGPGGTPIGFDVDLARALCDLLKVACTVQARRWDTIVPAIAAGAGDAAIASVSITDRALREVDFAGPYYRTPARFVATRAAQTLAIAPEALAGRRVGVEARTAHEAYLRAFFPKAEAVTFPSAEALRDALSKGQVELAFVDGTSFAGWLNSPAGQSCCAFVGGPYTETHFFGEGAGIALRRGRDDLRRALDYGLWTLAQNGTYEDLWLKYFPVSPY